MWKNTSTFIYRDRTSLVFGLPTDSYFIINFRKSVRFEGLKCKSVFVKKKLSLIGSAQTISWVV